MDEDHKEMTGQQHRVWQNVLYSEHTQLRDVKQFFLSGRKLNTKVMEAVEDEEDF